VPSGFPLKMCIVMTPIGMSTCILNITNSMPFIYQWFASHKLLINISHTYQLYHCRADAASTKRLYQQHFVAFQNISKI
jgi:hypothetical protein